MVLNGNFKKCYLGPEGKGEGSSLLILSEILTLMCI